MDLVVEITFYMSFNKTQNLLFLFVVELSNGLCENDIQSSKLL